MHPTDNLRIASIHEVSTPAVVQAELPLSEAAAETVTRTREQIRAVLSGEDDRLLAIVGPCSIHDTEAALAYARGLREAARALSQDLLIVMRVYFEKPRTTVGWKGLINDPDIDGSFRIDHGLRLARRLLRDLTEAGVPAGVEYLDLLTPQYISDLVSWGAIGARTTESQLHREMASGLSCPVGFKNGTDGSVKMAIDALVSASQPHRFLSMTKHGNVSIFETAGNPDAHVILRGGSQGPNYGAEHIDSTAAMLAKAGQPERILVDCSHANSAKQHRRQLDVAADLGRQISAGDRRIVGVMVESHLVEGRQDAPETFGQSITDACLGWDDTRELLDGLAAAVRARRAATMDTAANG